MTAAAQFEHVNAIRSERASRQARAAKAAADIWRASPPAGEHPYLQGIRAHELRQRGGQLVIPMRDSESELWNLQFIAQGGRSRNLYGGRVLGLHHTIGTVGADLHIAESYATAAKVHQQTGAAAAVAFELHNLRPVALALHARHPRAAITVWLPEPPQGTRGEVLGHRGALSAATAAARAVGGSVAVLWGAP